MWRAVLTGTCLVVLTAACSASEDGGHSRPDPARGTLTTTAGATRTADTAPCPKRSGHRIAGFPDVTLHCLTGPGSVDMAFVHGGPEVINIWASWCGPCREETALLQRAHAEAGDDVLFLGVDVRDSQSHASTFLADEGVTYPQVSDPAGSFPLMLRLAGVPNTLVVDGTGHVVYRRIGELNESQLRKALRRLEASEAH